MLSSYSNPESLVNYAIAQDYYVANFIVAPLTFGYYSSEPKVRNRILELKKMAKLLLRKHLPFGGVV